jgi:hypothetical protein
LAFDLAFLAFWCTLIWQGTRFRIFFSPAKRMWILALGVLRIAIIIASIGFVYFKEEEQKNIEGFRRKLFILIFNLVNWFFIFSSLLYYSQCKFKKGDPKKEEIFFENGC